MIRFDENIDYNFKYSRVWSSRIKDSFKLDEFEQYFKKLTKYITNLVSPNEIKSYKSISNINTF